ncbi:MAG: YbjN domain-containing protein [Firmicutes bacterium]|nr:YbjN domain-containing protein [Bacillota bacterium]
MAKTYSPELAKTVKNYLDMNDWHYSFDEGKGIYKCGVNLKGKVSECKLFIDIKDKAILNYAVINMRADESSRQKVAEFITRANYGLTFGNFEMDFEDGEIRYKMTVDCENQVPGYDVLDRMVVMPPLMFQRYGDGLLAVMFGFSEPKEAVEKSEEK